MKKNLNQPQENELQYLQLLSKTFPTIADASTEIINLQAILNLPKGTEHFLADIHGAYESFQHVLKNASGNIKRKVNELFGNQIRDTELRDLCTLIYYPEQKLEMVKLVEEDINDWYHITIHQLVTICRDVSSKYTRSKVRKSLPKEFSYIIQELLHEHSDDIDKAGYVTAVIDSMIETDSADDFIIAIAHVIQRLAIDRLHILGDIYDRGPAAHKILNLLTHYHNWDIQWGNHDMLWMGACAGNDACITNVVRISLRYANLTTLEEGYGINLLPLATFAMETYKDDPCLEFIPKTSGGTGVLDEKTVRLIAMMHKAISVIQFKVEAALIKKHPEWKMKDRMLFNNVDYDKGVCVIDGKEYAMKSCLFPTVDPKHPNVLTKEEEELMKKLHHSFTVSEKLRNHIELLLSHGCMYNITNNNLLFHASVPLNDDGSLKEVELFGGKKYSGRELMHHTGLLVRAAFQNDSSEAMRDFARDYFMYLWCGPDSTLFDKSKMATFERYFLTDKAIRHEEKGHYYHLREQADICDKILREFGLEAEHGHIINGHVPVKASKGETPVKADGKMMVIDGGFSKAYHDTTGIAGYTLVYHSRGFQLVQHDPFTSAEDAVKRGTDIVSTTQIVEFNAQRLNVRDTDIGRDLLRQIEELKLLLTAFRAGLIKERF